MYLDGDDMKYYKYKMNIGILNVVSIFLMSFGMIAFYLLFNDYNMNLSFIIYLILWLFLHEIIHGLTFMAFREVKKRSVVFGAKLESGIFYCMCKQPISKKVIIFSLLAPLFLIGFITLIIALIFDLPTLAFLSLFNISGAAGDIMMTIMFFKLPKKIKYTDLDDCEGFVVLSKDDLSNRKFLGFNLVESGDYSKDIRAHDFTKITCSKTSFIILIIVLILFIISLL